MNLETATEGQIAIVRVQGALDTRASVEFERRVLELYGGGARSFVFNFGGVSLLTSAGIRVLLMLAKRLGGMDRLIVCSPPEQVTVVFRISGMTGHLKVAATEAEAVALVAPQTQAAAASTERSKLTRLATRLLVADDAPEAGSGSPAPASGEGSTLTARMAELVIGRAGGAPGAPGA